MAPNLEDLLQHTSWVDRLSLGLVTDGHHAADVSQETWLAALQSGGPASHPRAWLGGIARNVTRRWARGERSRRARESRAADEERVDAPASDLVERAELQETVIRTVNQLAEPYRTTILLRYFEELEPAEIWESHFAEHAARTLDSTPP